MRDYTENNYLLGIWGLEELDAERCACWERPPQCEALTKPGVKAMAEGAMLRGESLAHGLFIHPVHSRVPENRTVQVVLLSLGLFHSQLLWTRFESFRWSIWAEPSSFHQVILRYWVLSLSEVIFQRENPNIYCLNDFCTLHKSKNVKSFFKKSHSYRKHSYKNDPYKPKLSFSRVCC